MMMRWAMLGRMWRRMMPTSETRDARALECAVDHVAPQQVGAQEMGAGMHQWQVPIEGDARQRRRIARLVEGLRRKDAVDDGPGLAGRERVGLARRIDPGNRVEER